jgi:hypothetical protein
MSSCEYNFLPGHPETTLAQYVAPCGRSDIEKGFQKNCQHSCSRSLLVAHPMVVTHMKARCSGRTSASRPTVPIISVSSRSNLVTTLIFHHPNWRSQRICSPEGYCGKTAHGSGCGLRSTPRKLVHRPEFEIDYYSSDYSSVTLV